jgi:hypothetical protein
VDDRVGYGSYKGPESCDDHRGARRWKQCLAGYEEDMGPNVEAAE